jgi:hypothetical protein
LKILRRRLVRWQIPLRDLLAADQQGGAKLTVRYFKIPSPKSKAAGKTAEFKAHFELQSGSN